MKMKRKRGSSTTSRHPSPTQAFSTATSTQPSQRGIIQDLRITKSTNDRVFMSSDITCHNDFMNFCFALLQDTMGWGENDRGVSFTFGAEVAAKFLHKHDFDLICRAHQGVEDGKNSKKNIHCDKLVFISYLA